MSQLVGGITVEVWMNFDQGAKIAEFWVGKKAGFFMLAGLCRGLGFRPSCRKQGKPLFNQKICLGNYCLPKSLKLFTQKTTPDGAGQINPPTPRD